MLRTAMRILHLAGEYPPARIGGISTFLENLATRQAHANEVGVIVVRGERYADDPPRAVEGDARAGVRVEPVDVDFAALDGRTVLCDADVSRAMTRPRGAFWEAPFDLLHLHDWYGALPAAAFARGGAAVVTSAHLPLRFGFTYANHDVPLRAKVRLETLGLRLASRVVAPSRYVADLLEREYDVDADRVGVVLNGVDLEAFSPGGRRAEVPTLLSVSRLSEQKGLDVLLAAFARVREAMPRARLEIAGDGPGRAALEAEIDRRGLRDAVTLHGYVRHAALRDLYRRAHAFVSASVYEPFGLTTLEAMACGTPAVASSLGGAPEFVRDGVDGFVCPPHGGELAAAAIRVLTGDVEAMGRAARARAETCSWDRVGGEVAREYALARGARVDA